MTTIYYDIKATIQMSTETVNLTSQQIKSYSINTTLCSEGIPLGCVASSAFEICFDATGSGLATKFNSLNDAKVTVQIKIDDGGDIESTWDPFGVWYVTSAEMEEDNPFITLSGEDAINTRFAKTAYYKNTSSVTYGALAADVCSMCGVTLSGSSFLNKSSNVTACNKEDLPENITCQSVLTYIATAAAGFARIAYDGKLEICTIADLMSNELTANANTYTSYSMAGGAGFSCASLIYTDYRYGDLNGTQVYGVQSGYNATNAVQISGNPFISDTQVLYVYQSLKGINSGASIDSMSVEWFGGSGVIAGSFIYVETKSYPVTSIITHNELTFDVGGLRCVSSCTMPGKTGDIIGPSGPCLKADEIQDGV